MSQPPKFSVIIPVRNREKLVVRAIESVLAQQSDDFEVICVENGSEDKTPEVLQTLADRDSRVRVFNLDHGDRCIARNKGLSEAHGEWICFLDSDDVYKNNHLKTLEDCIERYPDQRAFATTLAHQGGSKNEFAKLHETAMNLGHFIENNPLQLNQLCMNRSLVDNVSFCESESLPIAEDWLFFRELSMRADIFKVNTVTVELFDHEGRTMVQSDALEIGRYNQRSTELFIERNQVSSTIANGMLAHVFLLNAAILLEAGHKKHGRENLNRSAGFLRNWLKPRFYYTCTKFFLAS